MKVGSLVMWLGTYLSDGDKEIIERTKSVLPNTVDVYTVRGFNKSGTGIYLEEIVNGIGKYGVEISFSKKYFKEVQPPIDLTELLDTELSLTPTNHNYERK